MVILQQLSRSMGRYFLYTVFILSVVLFFFFDINTKISSSLLSTLPTSENKELLERSLKMQDGKKLFLAVKGEDKKTLEKLREIESRLLQIQGVQKEQFSQNKKLQEYKKRYQLYINNIDRKRFHSLDIKQEVEKLYQSIRESFFVVTIDTNDPLKVVEKQQQRVNLKNGRLFLKEYGYLSIFSLDQSIDSLEEYEQVYDQVSSIEQEYQDILTFSLIYYFVENSRYIKSDATTIGTIAVILLLVLYFVILRNLPLLVNTLIALASSAVFSITLLGVLYQEVSVFVLVFGISISTIAIDYMFHHYFHQHYKTRKSFNKEVFLGFLTTFGVFFIFSFSGFILIEQITLFAMSSLFFSYLLFSFLFPKIGFQQKKIPIGFKNLKYLKSKYIFFFSLVMIIASIWNLRFDFDISSLNYDNKKLQEKELFFKQHLLNSDKYTVIVKAQSIEELIQHNRLINSIDTKMKSPLNIFLSEKDFEKRKKELKELGMKELYKKLQIYANEVGFKEGIFKNAYRYELDFPKLSYEELQSYGIQIEKFKDHYITFIQVSKDKYEDVLKYDFTYSVSVKKLFEKSLQKEFDTLIFLGMVSVVFILGVMVLVAKQHSFQAISFLVFPSSLILIYSHFIQINILHLFMFFIILAICIDYGIYSVKNSDNKTQKAILFSALSSFAGFGVLIFSNTQALYSIGSVATLGIIGILILVFFQKGVDETTNL